MNKKKWIRIVSIYSIIYTVITLLNSVLYLCSGIYEDPSGNWHPVLQKENPESVKLNCMIRLKRSVFMPYSSFLKC